MWIYPWVSLPPATKLRQGNIVIFSQASVSHSVHRGEGLCLGPGRGISVRGEGGLCLGEVVSVHGGFLSGGGLCPGGGSLYRGVSGGGLC